MARSRTSHTWLKEHFNDPFVKKAHAQGLRSRAAFKLEELLGRDRLVKPGMTIVDLGAAPGGWAQIATRALAGRGKVIALDILDMPSIPGVDFIQADFREDSAVAALEARLDGARVDLVLSDMAPNMSGVESVDQARSMALAELARDFALTWLKPDGDFLVKLFHGVGFDDYVRDLRRHFTKVVVRKPKASRARSTEVYALGTGRKAQTP
jgi:23S rRNA (uridine2552-2'-O)-methyltransferase